MEVEFKDKSLDRLERDPGFTAGFAVSVVRSFRKKMNFIRQALDERDLYAMRSLNFEKLKGNRDGQYSIRLNNQWRLILEFEELKPEKIVVVVSIEDYH